MANRRLTSIKINSRRVGDNCPAYIIAEVAQAHDGSLGLAHNFVDCAADAGVDAIKFQTHFADAESTLDEPFRVKFSHQDETRYDYWKRMEFTDEQWKGLADHARERGLEFLSSAFSERAFELLNQLKVPAWKIASGEISSFGLLEKMASTGRPILLSTGLDTYEEIEKSANLVRRQNAPLAIFQCTSCYPTPYTKVGLNVIDELRQRFNCPVGLSDHSGTVFPAIIAMARGANLIEVHITLDQRMFGPDVSSSLTIEDLSLVRQARDALFEMDAHPVDKDKIAEKLSNIRALFQKSVAPVRPLAKGTVLERDMLTAKKPATGIPADRINELSGKILARPVSPDRVLTWGDIDE